MKPYRLRAAALGDVDLALDYYQDIRLDLAEGFQQDLLAALAHLQAQPGTGSPRYATHWLEQSPGVPLRYWLLKRFPYAIFYFEQTKHIDVVRVLHQASQIPEHLKNH